METVSTAFQKLKRLECEKDTLTPTFGRFFAEPLTRGFGTTLGNALRRVLISSLQGSAVTSVAIEGVYHEFSTIPGVLEDVTDIILNIKELKLKKYVDHPITMHLSVEGEKDVTASDIDTGSDVEVLNPEQPIITLNKEGKLDMELVVKTGQGYVTAEDNKDNDVSTQMIPIDAIFSPVRQANFIVEKTRVGHSTDFDKLILEVYTDGSVSPEDAIAQAAKILKNHLQLFINFEEEEEPEVPEVDEEKLKMATDLARSVEELELSVRSSNCLKNAEIQTISDLVQKTEQEMLRTRNFGRKSLNEIKEILTEMNLSLGMDLDELELPEIKEEAVSK
jgi:DNA-directed RNA polymerase subunit alpha